VAELPYVTELECLFTFVIKSVGMWLAVCQFIPSVCVFVCVGNYLVETMSWIQFSNLAKYAHGPPEDGFKRDRNM